MFGSKPPAPLPHPSPHAVSRVLYLSMWIQRLSETQRCSCSYFMLFVTRGPWLSFSLYSDITDPGENYRQQSQYIVFLFPRWARTVALMWPFKSLSRSAEYSTVATAADAAAALVTIHVFDEVFSPSRITHCLISATPQTLAVSARNFRNSWLLSHCVAFSPKWSTALLSLFNISAVLMFHVPLPSLSVPHRQIQAHDVSFAIKVRSRRTDSRQGCKWRVVGLSWVRSYLLSGIGVKRWWECTLVPAGTLLDRTIQRLCTVVKIIWSLHPFIDAVAHFISQQQRLDSRRKRSWAFFLYWKVDLIWICQTPAPFIYLMYQSLAASSATAAVNMARTEQE